jgi:molecular chaperone GrpE (heat shock protein)
VLTLERNAQALRLESAEQEKTIARLKADLERQRSSEKVVVAESVRAEIEKLMSDLAMPAAQLLTQAYLLDVEGKPVQAKDVLAVARRLVRSLEAVGLTIIGQVGEAVAFDPNRHTPLSAETAVQAGEKVKIKVVGIGYQGKVLQKAGVERV